MYLPNHFVGKRGEQENLGSNAEHGGQQKRLRSAFGPKADTGQSLGGGSGGEREDR